MNTKTMKTKHHLQLLLPFLLFFCLLLPGRAEAASKPATITDCKLSSASTVKVTASISNLSSVPGKKCYLFALNLSQSKITSGMKPLMAKAKAKKMSFSFPLYKAKTSSRLYSCFVLAARKSNGTYTIISNSKYLTNPGKTAKYHYRFPTATSKKGLQVSASMAEDAIELNVKHSVLNIIFTDMIATKAESRKSVSIPFNYLGKTYWFRRSVVADYDRQLKALKETDAIVSAILLLGWRDDLSYLITSSGREKGHAYYAWNTSNSKAREQLQATLSFLAQRYSSSSAKYGRIVNWIVGNEVNNYKVYNYAGKKSLSQYASIYANAFRLTYNTVTSIYANARVYISLDHLWNTNTVSGTFASRKMLDAFAKAINSRGYIPWNLAYHPYSSPLTEPKFWENTNNQLTASLTTPVINMGNIGLLTTYIREKYGSGTRIILSEQGYTSVQNGKNVEKEQSAAIVYSYYLTESDDMIDSFIMNRHVDHQVEIDQGLNLGLWTTDKSTSNPEWADKQKDSWTVFKYMDTNQSPKVADSSLSVINAGSWSELIEDYNPSLYRKTEIASAPVVLNANYKKKAGLSGNWKAYGAVNGLKKINGGWRTSHDNSRNRNCLWGFTQTFSKRVSFASASTFCTTLKVNGATGSKVRIKLRFYGKNNILESTCTIPAGKKVKLTVSLANWKYRKYVDKIQVLAAPVSGGWKNGAYMEMSQTVRG